MRYRFSGLWLNAWRALRKFAGPPPPGAFRILIFHDLPKSQQAAFERLLRYVVEEHGVLTPGEAEVRLQTKERQARDERVPCLLTFDDGFQSHTNVTKEILDRYDVKAIFFVCPGLTDVPREDQREVITTHIFDGCVRSADLPDEMALMSWSDLGALIASGHTVGSHTAYHRRLSELGEGERQQEIIGSSDLLKSKLGISVRWFATPFGDVASVDAESYKIIGTRYDFCCTGIRGLNSRTTHQLGLLREHLDLSIPFKYQKLVLEGGLDFWYKIQARRLQAMINKATVRAGMCKGA